MSDFENETSEISSLVSAKLDGLHIELRHVYEKLASMSESMEKSFSAAENKTRDLEIRLRALEIQAVQMPLKMMLLAAGSGMLGGGGVGAALKAIFGGG